MVYACIALLVDHQVYIFLRDSIIGSKISGIQWHFFWSQACPKTNRNRRKHAMFMRTQYLPAYLERLFVAGKGKISKMWIIASTSRVSPQKHSIRLKSTSEQVTAEGALTGILHLTAVTPYFYWTKCSTKKGTVKTVVPVYKMFCNRVFNCSFSVVYLCAS